MDGLRFAHRLSVVACVLLGVASVGGLLFGGRGLYDQDGAMRSALYAQDVVSLVLAIPLIVAAMRLTRRGSPAGMLIWAGALFYVAYMYFFYVVGVRFNVLFLVYVALESASLFALLALLLHLKPRELAGQFAGVPVRSTACFLIGIALLFAALWVGDTVRRLAAGETLDPVSRLVFAADLTVLLPACAGAGAMLWRRRPWGYALAGLLLVKTAASGITLLVGTTAQWAWGVAVDPAQLFGYVVIALGGLAFVMRFFRITRAPVTAEAS
jgi:hypothetical protein